MKIGKRHKVKHYCSSIYEVVDILNSQYTELHVRSVDWYLDNHREGSVRVPCCFVPKMKYFLGKTFSSFKAVYRPDYVRIEPIPQNGYSWSLEMFEEFDEFVIKIEKE